jgi:peptidyl-prolyl cis-trans isomerase C
MFIPRHLVLALLPVLVLATAACEKKLADDSKVLAKVNGEAVTEKDYQNYLQLRQSQQEPIADKERERKVVLDELIDRVLLSQHASATGMEQDPEVYFVLKRVRENVLAQSVVRKTLKDNPVTEEEMKKRFQEEAEKTHKTDYRVRHILVKSEEEAGSILKQLRGGARFDALAKQKSLDTQSGKNGGDLGWINQGMGFVPEFFNAVMAMKKGELSPAPVKSEFGWHIIKVEDTRASKLPTYEQFMDDRRAQANLRRRMQEERINAVLKDLKAKAKITVN